MIRHIVCGVTAIMGGTACVDNRPNVVLETALGEIEIEVRSDVAPITAGDFLYYVDNGLYDGQGFYRVVTPRNDPRRMGMEVVQGGLLGLVPVTQAVEHEPTSLTGLSNVAGSVSLARDAPGTGSAAYFFINLADNTFLDEGGERTPDGEGFATFGRVVRGMDTVRAIQAGDTMTDSPNPVTDGQFLVEPVVIERARRR